MPKLMLVPADLLNTMAGYIYQHVHRPMAEIEPLLAAVRACKPHEPDAPAVEPEQPPKTQTVN